MFFNKKHPYKYGSYAISQGTYLGEIWIYIKSDDDEHKFISIPKNINRSVTKEIFDNGLNGGLVDFVEKIPSKIWRLLEKQFLYNEKLQKH